jgi:hypothetical protein
LGPACSGIESVCHTRSRFVAGAKLALFEGTLKTQRKVARQSYNRRLKFTSPLGIVPSLGNAQPPCGKRRYHSQPAAIQGLARYHGPRHSSAVKGADGTDTTSSPASSPPPVPKEQLSTPAGAILGLVQSLLPVMTAILGGLWVVFVYLQNQHETAAAADKQATEQSITRRLEAQRPFLEKQLALYFRGGTGCRAPNRL